MEQRNMQQRSDEWFEARTGRITASRVGAILGNSPFRTRADVMREMVREALGAESEFQDNVAVRWGRDNEEGALLDFRLDTGLAVEPIGFVPLEDWAGVSPDGFTSDGGGVEQKCPYSLRAADAPVPFKTLAEQPHYRDQVQFSLYVTGRPHWYFSQWCPAGTAVEKELPCKDWQASNIPALRQFHAEFLAELKNPAEHLAAKRVEIDTPEAHKMAAEWDELKEQIANAQERQRDLLDAIVSLAGGKDALFAGRKLTCVERSGSVQWAKVAAKYCPDADTTPFTGKPSRFWRLG
jgi:putative phage-type endonuclease